MDLLQGLSDATKYGGLGVIIILLGLIKIPKLEINIWSWLGRAFGRTINHDVIEEIKSIKTDVQEVRKELQQHVEEDQLNDILTCRIRIIRFSDEIGEWSKGEKIHSKEHYKEILRNIDKYENYCETHKNFKNNEASFAIDNIKRTYNKHLKNNDFNQY